MPHTVPNTTVGLLTVTSKMPCRSWSLPAGRSCPSAFYGDAAKIVGGKAVNVDKSTICGSCYAQKGAYSWSGTQRAQQARFEWAIRAAADAATGDEFVDLMTAAIHMEGHRQKRAYTKAHGTLDGFTGQVFRVHDSGDLFSPQYARLWVRICHNLPWIKFWFPTRQWRTKNAVMATVLRELAALDNVSVRPSALRFDEPAPVVDGLAAGTGGFNVKGVALPMAGQPMMRACPAPTQNGECRDCRTCWTKDVQVSYKRH